MTKKLGKKMRVSKTGRTPSEADQRRDAFRQWLDHQGTNANEAAKKAGFSVSAIYNFLNGDTKSLSSNILNKLAQAYGSTVDDILYGRGGEKQSSVMRVEVLYRVGARGSMFVCDEKLVATAPQGVTLPDGVSAALIDGDGLAPIPNGWVVYFRNAPSEPAALLNKLATVRFSGGGDRPVVRTITRSQHDGLFTLCALDGTITEDVKIVAAHEIVAFGQAEVSLA